MGRFVAGRPYRSPEGYWTFRVRDLLTGRRFKVSSLVKDRGDSEEALRERLRYLIQQVNTRGRISTPDGSATMTITYPGLPEWAEKIGIEEAVRRLDRLVTLLDRRKNENGTDRCSTEESDSAIQEILAIVREIRANGLPQREEDKRLSPPWRQLFDEFVEAEVQGTQRYINEARRRADRWAEIVDPETPASDLQYADVERIMVTIRKGKEKKTKRGKGQTAKPKKRTLTVHLSNLKRFFAWCKKHGYVKENVALDYTRLRHEPDDKRERRAMEEDEARRLLRVCREPITHEVEYANRKGRGKQVWNPPDYLWWLFFIALKTGLRRRNILELRWSQLDLKAGELEISYKEMKKMRTLRVPLNSELLDALKKRKVETSPRSDDECILGRNVKDPKRAIRTALDRAKLEKFTFHDTRSTFSSWLEDKGANRSVIKTLLGHKLGASSDVTDGYTRAFVHSLREALESLPRLLDHKDARSDTKSDE